MGYTFNLNDFTFILEGMGITVVLCSVTMVLSLAAAFCLGVFRALASKLLVIRLVQLVLTLLIGVLRGTPLMLQLMFLFFGLPFVGVNLSPATSAVLGLSVYSTAYLAEIVRTGIESVAKDQWDGAAALGFTYLQTMRAVILPQAVRIMIPPTVSFFLGLIKDSSLCAVIGFVELARAGRIIVEKTHQSLLIFSIVALLYFVICYPISRWSQRLEKQLES